MEETRDEKYEKANEIVDKETKINQEIEVSVDLENTEDASRSYQQWMYFFIICDEEGHKWFECFFGRICVEILA